MPKPDWTYEIPPAGADAAGLEEYVVYAADGAPAGKVVTIVRRGEERYVVLDRGTPPFRHDRRAIPWDAVAAIDPATAAVELGLTTGDIEATPALPAERAVEPVPGETSAADAVRVTDLPELAGSVPESLAGRATIERTGLYGTALGLGLVAVLAFLVVVAIVSAAGADWAPLFAVPAVLGAAAAFLAYRLWRRPYEGPPEGRHL
jgi:hypothetical protein